MSADQDGGPSILADGVIERVQVLGRLLRAQGVEISLSELLDAGPAVAAVGLSSRSHLRTALRTTLIKDARHLDTFDAAFDRAFPQRVAGAAARGAGAAGGPDGSTGAHHLADGDALPLLAAELVDQHGGLDGDVRGERHHVQRVYRAADLARLMSEARKLDPTITPDELRRRIDELKRLIASDVRAQLDHPDVASGIEADLRDLDFLRASRAELEQIRDIVRPLARRLASRFARRRSQRRDGRFSMRRTLRRSLASGGVPIDVVAERPRRQRPDLFVLCDISGSMADVSLFTLTLMAALSSEVGRTRSFVFVDAIDEVTELLAATEHGIEPWQILRNTNVIGDDGHSDYGSVLRQFWTEVGEQDLRPSSTVLITGDARTNHRPAEDAVLGHMARRCRRIYWLNPEPKDDWDTEDSEMSAYAAHCADTFEVRNLRQLMACVENVL